MWSPTDIFRAPHGNLGNQCFSYPTGPVWVLCRSRKCAVWHPCWHVRALTQPELANIPHGHHIWPYGAHTGPLWSPHRLLMGCLRSGNPKRAHKLVLHASKLYKPLMGKQNSYGATLGPCRPHEWTYNSCSKQPLSSPYGAPECDVTRA